MTATTLQDQRERIAPVDADRATRRACVDRRLGRGTFRTRVIDAYGCRSTITSEGTLPVLEAVHIKPYAQNGPNRVKNGLLLPHRPDERPNRACIHHHHRTLRRGERQ